MNNKDLYTAIFCESFGINEVDALKLTYQSIDAWDSVGHMSLMALLEERFEIEIDIDDIIDFSSFEKGIEILAKYDINI